MGCSSSPDIQVSVNLSQDEEKSKSKLNLKSKDENEKHIKSKNEKQKEMKENEKQNKNEKLKDINGNKKLKEIKGNKKQNENKNEKQNNNEIGNEDKKKQDNNAINDLEKQRLLELEIKRLEEEKKQKEKEEKEKKEKEEKERKENEEREIQEFEKNEKERQENEKKGIKEKYDLYLYLLLKNLEAINKDIEELREAINQVFNSKMDYMHNDYEKTKNSIIGKVLDKIKEYLEIKNNYTDINIIKYLLIISFEEKNIDLFKEHLNIILNSVKNYNNLKNENSIINDIIDYLSEKEDLKEEVEKIYKERKIIKYDDFCKITKQFEVAMPETQMEYLIYKMKSTKLEDVTLMFDELNALEFLEFFKEENKKEDNSIKIRIRIRD